VLLPDAVMSVLSDPDGSRTMNTLLAPPSAFDVMSTVLSASNTPARGRQPEMAHSGRPRCHRSSFA
jgi:hypothetical protein